jgi:hypothetical protein
MTNIRIQLHGYFSDRLFVADKNPSPLLTFLSVNVWNNLHDVDGWLSISIEWSFIDTTERNARFMQLCWKRLKSFLDHQTRAPMNTLWWLYQCLWPSRLPSYSAYGFPCVRIHQGCTKLLLERQNIHNELSDLSAVQIIIFKLTQKSGIAFGFYALLKDVFHNVSLSV